jgi:uncharacterized protein YbjT (DUF2867 family)
VQLSNATAQTTTKETMTEAELILVTGVTGYVGGRLAPRLLEAGYPVRVLTRGGRSRLVGRPWADAVEIADGDVLQPESLAAAMAGVHTAYYLIHSISGSAHFGERDSRAAENFAHAAAAAGVQRIIYLGGLGDPKTNLSEHLRSRQETGDALRTAGVPVTEFRAGMVVGSGSLSFEMLRHLCERLPAMLCPKWVYTRTQPIAIRDVLSYLITALKTPASSGQTIEIGGATVLPYVEMMRTYARVRELPRLMIPIPALTPGLSAYWVHWMTPVSARMAHPLIQGLRNEMIVRDSLAKELFPTIEPLDFTTSVRLALRRIEEGDVETVWSDALASSRGDLPAVYLTQEQGMLIERREQKVAAPPEVVYRTVTGIGGARGWPAFHWLWELRGILDRLFGGVGMRRGRRHPDQLRRGDVLDFWRVEALEPNRSVVLHAEMKLPGQGWLQFEVKPGATAGSSSLVQTAYFASKGLAGLLYWYALYPLHGFIFSSMIANLAAQAEAAAQEHDVVTATYR